MRSLMTSVGITLGLMTLFGALELVRNSSRADEHSPSSAVPHLEGTGTYTRKVTGANAEAQRYFDQGLNLIFAFNLDEAIRAFEAATASAPDCAMAYWGLALAHGPHYNHLSVTPQHAQAAWEALTKAREKSAPCTDVEKALIEALGKRYANPQPNDRTPLDKAYSDALRKVWKQFPHDADVGALFAESAMDLHPWDLWTRNSEPQPGTLEILSTLEAVLALSPSHPLANHLYVHAMEASPIPEKADAAADQLRLATPGLGHLVHMPSHIDVRRGRWQQAIEANLRAIEADRKYQRVVPRQGGYRTYMAHNHCMLAFAAMMQGESQRAIEAARTMVSEIPKDWMQQDENVMYADYLLAFPIEVLMRFGRWDDILREPIPSERFPIARALHFSAQALAHATRGRTDEAREIQKSFRAVVANVPKTTRVRASTAAELLAVAEAQLEGEILFKEGKINEGLHALRQAVANEDKLKYNEPPNWLSPVRHALGASLLRAGKPAEAELVYREDLVHWPENGWSLYGLARSLEAQGKQQEAAEVQKRFKRVWQKADVKLTSSCFCQAK